MALTARDRLLVEAAAAAPTDPCEACRVVGPLITGTGTSGRSWRCECGYLWLGARDRLTVLTAEDDSASHLGRS